MLPVLQFQIDWDDNEEHYRAWEEVCCARPFDTLLVRLVIIAAA